MTSITVEDKKKVKASQKECEWNIECINAQKAYEESKNCKRIKVAVLDSGLDYDEDIPFVEREDFFGEEDMSVLYQDYTGHGTCISGLICAKENTQRVTGLAANVDLYMARVLDENNEADIERVIRAIRWAMDKKVNIIHMSFGIKTYSEALNEVVQEAYEKGILLVAAAGNDGTADENESTVEYPAAFENVIAVGCTNEKNKKADFSSSGNEIDVVAPGEKILGSGEFGGVVVEEGTSIAAAQVTGIAAVLWGMHPEKSNDYIREWIISSANDTIGKNCGNGMIDYEQTKKNYEWMEENYQRNKEKGYSEEKSVEISGDKLPENHAEIEEHQVNYVVGSWKKSAHIKFVKDGIEQNDFSVTKKEIRLIKLGAQKIDKLGATMGMKNNQCFHGGGNYVANTQYLYSMYRKYVDYDEEDEKVVSGQNISNTTQEKGKVYKKLEMLAYTEVFDGKDPYADAKEEREEEAKEKGKTAKSFDPYDIKERLDETQETIFRNFIGKNKKKWTYKKRAYIILGMAIHTATDAFSHRAFKKVKINGKEAIWQTVHDSRKSTRKKTSVSIVWNKLNNHLLKKSQKTPIYTELMNKVMISDDTIKLRPLYNEAMLLSKMIIARAKAKKATIYTCYKKIGNKRSKLNKKKRKQVSKYKVANFRKYLKTFIDLKKNDWKYINYSDKDYTINFSKEDIKYFKANNGGIKMKYRKNYIYGVLAVKGKKEKLLQQSKIKKGKIYFVYKGGKLNYSKYNKIKVTITTPLKVKTFTKNIIIKKKVEGDKNEGSKGKKKKSGKKEKKNQSKNKNIGKNVKKNKSQKRSSGKNAKKTKSKKSNKKK